MDNIKITFFMIVTDRGMVIADYALLDSWEDRVHSCKVPFYPDKSVRYYSGLYFRLIA